MPDSRTTAHVRVLMEALPIKSIEGREADDGWIVYGPFVDYEADTLPLALRGAVNDVAVTLDVDPSQIHVDLSVTT